MRRWIVALAPAVALVLAGCADGSVGGGEADEAVATVDGEAGEPTSDIPVISTEAQMLSHSALPLDAYSLELDQFVIQVAEHKLLAECMADQGFQLEPFPPPGYEPAPRQPRLTKYGVGLIEEVEEFGYVPPPKYSGVRQPPPPAPRSPARQAAFDVALLGPVAERSADEPMVLPGGIGTMHVPGFAPGSCTDRMYEALGVSDHRQLLISHGSDLVASLVSDTTHAARADSRSVSADSAWSECMRDRGFEVPSPDESSNTYIELDLELQVPVAVADVECKYATNYFGIRFGVESAYQRAAIEERFQELEAIAAEHRVTLERAEAVLNE